MNSTETICDDNGIELMVGYKYDRSESQTEQGHGEHEVGCLVETELTFVELVIAGRDINILPMLKENQIEHIISKLQY